MDKKRRNILQATSGITLAKWGMPLVTAVTLPTHAQTSEPSCAFAGGEQFTGGSFDTIQVFIRVTTANMVEVNINTPSSIFSNSFTLNADGTFSGTFGDIPVSGSLNCADGTGSITFEGMTTPLLSA